MTLRFVTASVLLIAGTAFAESPEELFKAANDAGACGRDIVVICSPRREILIQGGAPLAEWLIARYEAILGSMSATDVLSPNGENPVAYLKYIAATRSEVGIRYAIHEAMQPHQPGLKQYALQSLVHAGDARACDLAERILSDPAEKFWHVLAVTIIRGNLRAGVKRPSDVALLRRLEAGSDPLHPNRPDLRGTAYRALTDLEARGLVEPTEHPADLRATIRVE